MYPKKRRLRRLVLVSNKKLKLVLSISLICFFGLVAQAQCAMCRAAISNDANKTKAEAVNDGIVYLMAIPYILVGLLGVYIYKMYQKSNK